VELTVTNQVSGPSVVSLFAGAGGTDVGLERAGWRTVLATDIDSACVATLQAAKQAGIPVSNQEGVTYLREAELRLADVRDLSGDDLKPAGVPQGWCPDLLAGGPPCQPWSSAGLQKGLQDERGQLIDHFVRLAGELRPHFVLFENVRGLVTAIGRTGKPGEVLADIKKSFEDIGYATAFTTLNAADYGVSQRRVRLYMVATRDYGLPFFPEPTHARNEDLDLFSIRKSWVDLGSFIDDLPRPDPNEFIRPTESREAELSALRPGTGLRTAGRTENNRPGGHWGYRQDSFVADLSLPSRTIRAASTPDWIRLPDATHRRLTWRECAALQGFPYEWPFQGALTSKFRQIGNAVQADMAEVLGRSILASLYGGRLRQKPRSTDLPEEFGRRIKYTTAEHRTNGSHRVRVRASVTSPE
jgi:DNA (cytosine-5)-methyltransferase 1